MNGTYDLDGDNMLEFLALELDPNKDVFPTAVRFYEIDSDGCLLYTSPSPRDATLSRMPSSA